jgi:integrase
VASVERRETRQGAGATYVVRYRDPAGKQRAKSFDRKRDADAFAATVEADKLRGTYLDTARGRVTLEEYARGWLAAQTFDESTREAVELRLRLHVYPHLGGTPLGQLRPSAVQAGLRGLSQTLASRYVRVIAANLSAVLSAAVDDERIPRNPCRAGSVKLPKADPDCVVPWSVAQVRAVTEQLPAAYRPLAVLCAGLGLRQGEAFGLAVEDVDFLRGVVTVQRQVKWVGGRRLFALPKGRKVREVPLPEVVALELAAHLAERPPVEIELPWETPEGKARRARLFVTSRERGACDRN